MTNTTELLFSIFFGLLTSVCLGALMVIVMFNIMLSAKFLNKEQLFKRAEHWYNNTLSMFTLWSFMHALMTIIIIICIKKGWLL